MDQIPAQQPERSADAGAPVALIYSRLSRKDQAEEGASLHFQTTVCRRYAEANGWPVHAELEEVASRRRLCPRSDGPTTLATAEALTRDAAAPVPP